MPNVFVTALAQNKETFTDSRLYLYNLFNSNRDKVLQLEDANVDTCIPYYISYIESKGIVFQEAINYFAYDFPSSNYWELVKVTIINTFRKIENKDFNFTPY